MTTLNQIAYDFVERAAALDPILATRVGVAGHDHELPSLSTDGFRERAELNRSTLAAVNALTPTDSAERVAKLAMVERLGVAVEGHDAGDDTRALNVIACGVQDVRKSFDLMPTDGEQAQYSIARRMAEVPRAYRELAATLLEAARDGRAPAERQVTEVAKQCTNWTKPAGGGFYRNLVARLGVPQSAGALKGDLDQGAAAAERATAELGEFLTRELLPLAVESDAVGRERYARASREFLGAAVDLDEAYAYGWCEVHRLEAEQRRVANLIKPRATVIEAMEALEADPKRRIAGR